jgi:RNA polymerase sigma-70 factor (ECF subfamily)
MSTAANTTIPDRELFARIAQGEEAAFELLFHQFVPRLRPVLFSMVGSEAAVKDIIQDIFLNIWISRYKLTSIEVPANWIYKIMYNRAYTWLEQQASQKRRRADMQSLSQQDAAADTTEESVFFAETARLVNEAIHALPSRTRHIYQLSRETSMKQQEIADHLGVSLQTVKNTLYKAGQSIREYLQNHGIVLPVLLFYSINFFSFQ